MQSAQQIMRTTEQTNGPVCDKCLSKLAPAGEEFQPDDIRRKLAKTGILAREMGTCSQCGAESIVNRFDAPAPGAPTQDSVGGAEATTEQYLEAIAVQLNATAQNIVAQGQINERVVSRLLNLESNLKQLDRKMQTLISTGGLGRQPSVYMGDNIVLTRVLGRFKMLVDTSDLCNVSGLIADGHLDMGTTDYLDGLLNPGLTIVELGAGIGYYTLILAAGVGPTGRVHAIESNAKNFELLNKNLEGNGLSERFGYDVHTHAAGAPNAKLLEMFSEKSLDIVKVGASAFTAETLETLKSLSAKSPAVQCVVDFSRGVFHDAGIDSATLFSAIRRSGFAAKLLGLRGAFDPAWDGLSVPGAATGTFVLTKI